ncbi:hypothetical protein SAMN04488554_3926 [Ruania alba]|uniref:Uncharacterized protein n=1 Tax=Ruania alba TaxID=648782 RepID=A0A1H5N4M3_9MICO|nr:hypothetical protein SAMN04488554_3926 [Ruania alba]
MTPFAPSTKRHSPKRTAELTFAVTVRQDPAIDDGLRVSRPSKESWPNEEEVERPELVVQQV